MRGFVVFARGASIAIASMLVMNAAACNKLGKAPEISCAEGKCPEIEPMEGTTLVVQSKDRFLAGVRMSLSPASLTSAVAIHIEQAREPLDYSIVTRHRAMPIGRTVKFSPHGLSFLHDPLVDLPFDTARLAKMPANARIRVALGAGDGKDVEWIEPEKIDREKGIVSFRIPHFSDAAVVADEPGAPAGPLVQPAPPPPPPANDPGPGACQPWMDDMIAVVKCGEDGGKGGNRGGGGSRFGPGVSDECPATFDEGAFWKDISLHGIVEAPLRIGRLGLYLYIEDGAYMPTGAIKYPVRPLRTNQEVDLYNAIKAHIKKNPGQPLAQEDVMRLALEATRDRDDDNKCFKNVLTASMTAHNVMRLLARPEQWSGHIVDLDGKTCTTAEDLDRCNRRDDGAWGHNVDDPALPMLMDLANSTSSDGEATLPQLLQAQKRAQLKPGRADFGWMGGLFGNLKAFAEPPGLNEPCAPKDKVCRDSHAGGCAYYHWTGAMGMGGLGNLLASYGFNKESSVKNELGQSERGSFEVACARKGAETMRCLKYILDGTIPYDCDKRKNKNEPSKPSGPKPPAPPAPQQCQPACVAPKTCSKGACYCPPCHVNSTLDLATCQCKRRGSY